MTDEIFEAAGLRPCHGLQPFGRYSKKTFHLNCRVCSRRLSSANLQLLVECWNLVIENEPAPMAQKRSHNEHSTF